MTKKTSTNRKTPRKPTQASQADPHALYELAVQQPVVMISLLQQLLEERNEALVQREERGEASIVLREDFCGTANLASVWVRSGDGRRAVGVDLDPAMIEYAERHSRAPLGDAAGRLKLIEADVLGSRATADMLVSLNFSHFIYHKREELVRYLKHARRCLREDGFMVLDVYAGPGAMLQCNDPRKFGDFTYYWHQASFDPGTHLVTNHIHFAFPDRSRLDEAFTYHWRLYTIPELVDAMTEAGFRDVEVLYETEEGYTDEIDPEAHEAWVGYLVGSK